MTIELITGSPGAGKTTYAVATRMASEANREFEIPADECLRLGRPPGHRVKRRVVQAGIKGLLVEHERLPHTLTGEKLNQGQIDDWNKLDADGEPVFKRLPADPPRDDQEMSLFNWWLWCRPGDLIVVDEVQFIVPRGSVGKKPPHWIALLEIHRHYGVDFLFITQHPQLLDTTIRALVGMHRHVRSVMGSGLCMVYEWDHASNPERYSNATKSKFLRGPKHYRLFKSSVLHVKPPSSGRAVLWLAPVMIGVAVFFGYRTIAPKTAIAADASVVHTDPVYLASLAKPEAGTVPPASRAIEVRGCWATPTRCECVDSTGQPAFIPEPLCRKSASGFGGLVKWAPQDPPLQKEYGAAARPALAGSMPTT